MNLFQSLKYFFNDENFNFLQDFKMYADQLFARDKNSKMN